MSMTKDELRAALTAIDAELAAPEEAAKPARAALKPFEDAIKEIDERRELLLEKNEAVYLGKCEFCSRILFEGDKGCRDSYEGGLLCEGCSPTLGEALKNNLDAKAADPDDENLDNSIAHIQKRIALEGPGVKLLYPL
jgi:hypothetical protein